MSYLQSEPLLEPPAPKRPKMPLSVDMGEALHEQQGNCPPAAAEIMAQSCIKEEPVSWDEEPLVEGTRLNPTALLDVAIKEEPDDRVTPTIVKAEHAVESDCYDVDIEDTGRSPSHETLGLSSVQLFGHEVKYRLSGRVILFVSSSLEQLIGSRLPMPPTMSIDNLIQADSVEGEKTKDGEIPASDNVAAKDNVTDKDEVIQWKTLKAMLSSKVLEVAVRTLLLNYRPFASCQVSDSFDETKLVKLGQLPCIKLANQSVPFILKIKKVSVDEIEARVESEIQLFVGCQPVLGLLKDRTNFDRSSEFADKSSLESLLIKEGFTPVNSTMISYRKQPKDANDVDEVDDADNLLLLRLDVLLQLLEDTYVHPLLKHIQEQVESVKVKQEELTEELGQTVDMILREFVNHDMIVPEKGKLSQIGDKELVCDVSTTVTEKPFLSPPFQRAYKECHNVECGRRYHFIVRCCSESHSLSLGSGTQPIPYFYNPKDGQIYLEKCAAFTAIGQVNIVRCSNYKRVDRVLREKGMEPRDHFMTTSLESDVGTSKRKRRKRGDHELDVDQGGRSKRHRRNHISLQAFLALAQDENLCRGGSCNYNSPEYQSVLARLRAQLVDLQSNDHQDGCRESEPGLRDKCAGKLRAGRSKIDDLAIADSPSHVTIKEEENEIDLIDQETQSSSGVESEGGDDCFYDDDFDVEELQDDDHADKNSLTECQDGKPSEPRKLKNLEEEMSVRSVVTLLGLQVEYRIVDSRFLFLRKCTIYRILGLKGPSQKIKLLVEKASSAQNYDIRKVFLYEGRTSNYISSSAVRAFLLSSVEDADVEMNPPTGKLKSELLSQLDKLESNLEQLIVVRPLELKTLGTVYYQMRRDQLYLDTTTVLRLSGYQKHLLASSPSKANLHIKKLLEHKGINVKACFLRHRNSKYAFLSYSSCKTLLQYVIENHDSSPTAQKLKKELNGAIRKLTGRDVYSELAGPPPPPSTEIKSIKISDRYPSIRYKIQSGGGRIYFHRKSAFECVGLEHVIMLNRKGFSPINTILADLGLDVSQVYLQSRQEVFAYISCPALIMLLSNASDPLLVLLQRKFHFLAHLLATIENGVCEQFGAEGNLLVDSHKIPYRTFNGRLYLDRKVVFNFSRLSYFSSWMEDVNMGADPLEILQNKGFSLEDCFLPLAGKPAIGSTEGCDLNFMRLDVLLGLMSIDGDGGRGSDYHSILLRDTLSAISIQEPRLRNYVRMTSFRIALLNKICSEFARTLNQESDVIDVEGIESGMEVDPITSDDDLIGFPLMSKGNGRPDKASSDSDAASRQLSQQSSVEETANGSPDDEGANKDPIATIKTGNEDHSDASLAVIISNLIDAAGGEIGGTIGDWELMSVHPVTHFSVRAGYGASRKISFLNPNIAAILCYDLRLTPSSCQLSINHRDISQEIVDKLVNRSRREGSLSLLYHVISLRPCFGYYSPELVETVSHALAYSTQDLANTLFLDLNFIGSSSNGRTYAGTVRSVDCQNIAHTRVDDRCEFCSQLDSLIINRSLLSAEAGVCLTKHSKSDKVGESSESSFPTSPSHQSVWKLDTTDEKGCSFLCPQVQTFNSSLPHAFVGSAQASTVVDHRVEISDKLQLKVELSGRRLQRQFPEFCQNRQLGPLLDCVAGLRLCVGYPATSIVSQARFLLSHMGRLSPDIRKLFKHLAVDENFQFRTHSAEESGTIRSKSCEVEAEEGADICAQCRALQQPLEFM